MSNSLSNTKSTIYSNKLKIYTRSSQQKLNNKWKLSSIKLKHLHNSSSNFSSSVKITRTIHPIVNLIPLIKLNTWITTWKSLLNSTQQTCHRLSVRMKNLISFVSMPNVSLSSLNSDSLSNHNYMQTISKKRLVIAKPSGLLPIIRVDTLHFNLISHAIPLKNQN